MQTLNYFAIMNYTFSTLPQLHYKNDSEYFSVQNKKDGFEYTQKDDMKDQLHPHIVLLAI